MTRVIFLIDNLHEAQDGTEVKADHTLRITWQVDGGSLQNAELDLTTAHTEEYLSLLAEMTKHGNKDSGIKLPPKRAAIATKNSAASPVRNEGLDVSRRYRKKQRIWVEEHDITRRDGSGKLACVTPAGGDYWPRWLNRAYEYYLATGQIVLPEMQRDFRGDDMDYDSYVRRWNPPPIGAVDAGLHGDRPAGRVRRGAVRVSGPERPALGRGRRHGHHDGRLR